MAPAEHTKSTIVCYPRTMSVLVELFRMAALLLGLAATVTGIISFGWLITLRAWPALLSGIVTIVLSPLLISLFLLPSVGLAIAMQALVRRRIKPLAIGLMFVNSLYLTVVFSLWGLLVFRHFAASWGETTPHAPLVLWAFQIALSPLETLALKDGRRAASMLTLLCCALTYLGLAVCILADADSSVFLIVIAVFSGLNFVQLFAHQRALLHQEIRNGLHPGKAGKLAA